jgi:hypothetical protein
MQAEQFYKANTFFNFRMEVAALLTGLDVDYDTVNRISSCFEQKVDFRKMQVDVEISAEFKKIVLVEIITHFIEGDIKKGNNFCALEILFDSPFMLRIMKRFEQSDNIDDNLTREIVRIILQIFNAAKRIVGFPEDTPLRDLIGAEKASNMTAYIKKKVSALIRTHMLGVSKEGLSLDKYCGG